MDNNTLGGLLNSISRFILLVSCQSAKTTAALKDLRTVVSILRFLKPVLDEIHDSEIASDGKLHCLFEELDMLVNDAQDTLEKQQPQRKSRLCSVFKNGRLVTKVQNSSLRLCRLIQDLLKCYPSKLLSTSIEKIMEEIHCANQDLTSVLVVNALGQRKESNRELLIRVAESVGLVSNHELLVEWICLEKEKEKEPHRSKEETECLANSIDLFHQIRDYLEKRDQFALKKGVTIPSYFRCHLSLELMVDPVILASGQTYERSFIQKWLDNGLKICPKTRQTLPHSTLVPNDTVKALIANWCRENQVNLHHSVETKIGLYPCSCSSMSEESLRDSLDKDFDSTSCHEMISEPQQVLGMVCHNSGKEVSITSHQSKAHGTLDFDSCIHEEPYVHTRSESISSINSTTELLGKSEDRTNSSQELVIAPWISSEIDPQSSLKTNNGHECHMLSIVPCFDILAPAQVHKLIEDLNSQSTDLKTKAAMSLRLLARDSRENRILIARCGAIKPLISLLYCNEEMVQENSVTALLNLSISDNGNKIAMVDCGVIESFIHVLKHGNAETKGNAAAALFSLSTLEEFRIRIGRSGAIKPLVDLLRFGNVRGKKDAAAALFSLSIFHENKSRIVQAGAVKQLVEHLDPEKGMVDKSVALLANLSTVPEGCVAISEEGGIPLLVEVVDSGSQRGKENAASTLLQLCVHSQRLGSMVLQEGAIPPLVALSQQGTPRAKDKAQQILGHFRSLRDRSFGKSKS